MKFPHFNPPPYNPRWWAFNAHIHTIIPSFFDNTPKPPYSRYEINTPDEDFLEADVIEVNSQKPIVALFHGLEGSTDRYYINTLMKRLKSSGYSSAALNFRGCGSRVNNKKRFYHSGATQDYDTFINWLSSAYPEKKIYAVGYSLGGNALVKYLAEQNSKSLILRAVAVSPPYDLKKGSVNLQKGFNRIYEKNFLTTLVEKLESKREKFPDLPAFNGRSVYEFDDQITAALHGFKNADDYYQKCSSKHFYKAVTTPLLIIHSKLDTLCPLKYAPFEDIHKNPAIETLFTETGGHVGFLSSPRGWLNRTIIKWLET